MRRFCAGLVLLVVGCDDAGGSGGLDGAPPDGPGAQGADATPAVDAAAPADAALLPLAAPAAVDVGLVDCGGSGSHTFVLENPGDEAVAFTIFTVGELFTAEPAGGSVEPHAAQTITVTGHAPAGATPAVPQGADLTIVQPPYADLVVAASLTPRGAALTYEAVTDFVYSCASTPVGTQKFLRIKNDGNATVSMQYSANLVNPLAAVTSTGGAYDLPAGQQNETFGAEFTNLVACNPMGMGSIGAAVTAGPVCTTTAQQVPVTVGP